MAELADALDLGSSGETRGGSTPPPRTFFLFGDDVPSRLRCRESGAHRLRATSPRHLGQSLLIAVRDGTLDWGVQV